MSAFYKQDPFNLDGIKIFIEKTESYVAEMYHQYSRLLQNHQFQIDALLDASFISPYRKNTLYNLLAAKRQNLDYVNRVVSSLEKYVRVSELIKIRDGNDYHPGDNNLYGYLKDLKYLQRDWCDKREGNEQLEAIIAKLRTIVQRFGLNNETCLFVGAGTGKIAVEMSDLFQRTIGMDKSFSMAYSFKRLQAGERIEFYEINEFNIIDTMHSVQKLSASGSHAKNDISRLEYIVADVTDLPIANEKLSVVVTAYFIDVIALRAYFNEIDRTLADGGLFINIGPLDYFFRDLTEMLSAEEVTNYFVRAGYEVFCNESLETAHLQSDLSLNTKIYKNWVFAARKRSAKKGSGITIDTNVRLNGDIQFQTTFVVSAEGRKYTELAVLGEGALRLDVDESVFNILQHCVEAISIKQLLELATANEAQDLDNDAMLSFIEKMIASKVLITLPK